MCPAWGACATECVSGPDPSRGKKSAAVTGRVSFAHRHPEENRNRLRQTSPTPPSARGPVALPAGEVPPHPHLHGGIRAHTAAILVAVQTMTSFSAALPSHGEPRPAPCKGTKRTQKATFFRKETIAFYACQASGEIQNKTHHCEREYEIKGAFITLGSALFEILTFPL